MKLSTSVRYFDHRLQVFLISSSFVCVPNEYFKYKSVQIMFTTYAKSASVVKNLMLLVCLL